MDDPPPQQPQWRAIQPPKLPRFSGEVAGCGGDEFVQEAERVINNYQLKEGTAVEWVLQSLEGVARREILSRPADDINTAVKVLEIVRDTFGDQRGLSALLTSFHGRRQGIGEGVIEYAQSLLVLSTRLNAVKPGTTNATILRDRLVDGLHPPSLRRDIRRYVREHDDVTFQQARAEALRWMREDSELEVRSEQIQVAPPQIQPEVDELRAQVAALMAKTDELQAELKRRHHAPATASQQSMSARTTICYWCQRPGHLQRDCRARQAYNQQQQQQGPRPNRHDQGPQSHPPRNGNGPRLSSLQGN